MATGIWEKLAQVESASEPGKTHVISRRVDGRLGCTCTSYRFARGVDKSCKHIRALLLGSVSHGWAAHTATDEQVHVKADDGERFLVRRAISFGGISAVAPVTAQVPEPTGVMVSRSTAQRLLKLVTEQESVVSLRSERARWHAMAQEIREALR